MINMPIRIKYSRVFICLLLVALLLCLCTYHYTNMEEHLEYPATKMIQQYPESYDGWAIAKGGTITEVGESSFVITAMDRDIRFDFVIDTKAEVYPGDVVEVLGIFRSPNRILPEKMIVTPAQSQRMVYVRSLIGLFILVIAFFRSWKFDCKRMAFIPRRNK
jgi:hypothetical protein